MVGPGRNSRDGAYSRHSRLRDSNCIWLGVFVVRDFYRSATAEAALFEAIFQALQSQPLSNTAWRVSNWLPSSMTVRVRGRRGYHPVITHSLAVPAKALSRDATKTHPDK